MPPERAEEIMPGAAALDVIATERGGAISVRLAGALDVSGRPAVATAIANALARHPRALVLDLSRLTFADSTVIHVALDAMNRTAAQHVELRLVPGPPSVQRVFALAVTAEHGVAFPWRQDDESPAGAGLS